MTDPTDAAPGAPAESGARGRWLTDRVESDIRHAEDRFVPAWLRPTDAENRLPAGAAIAVAIFLQLSLPVKYGLHPRWVLPGMELVLLIALTILNPVRLTRRTAFGRYGALLMVALSAKICISGFNCLMRAVKISRVGPRLSSSIKWISSRTITESELMSQPAFERKSESTFSAVAINI